MPLLYGWSCVICADVNAHDTAWDQTANPIARGEYIANAAMVANSTFFKDPEQPTRQVPATGAFSSRDVTIVHAAFRERYDCEPLNTPSSDHRPTIVTTHLPTDKLREDKWLIWDWTKGDLAANTTAVDDQLRGTELTDGEFLKMKMRDF